MKKYFHFIFLSTHKFVGICIFYINIHKIDQLIYYIKEGFWDQ